MKMYLGTMNYKDVDSAYKAIKEAHKAGYYGIDSAKIYRNEEVIGEAVERLRNEGIDIKVQTKIWTTDFKKAKREFKAMLVRLKLDKVDSLLLHRPSLTFANDIKAWKVLIKLQKEGKVNHIGLSNYDKDMIQILIAETGVKPFANQIEMSLSNFREDRLVYNNAEGIEIQAWSPMGKDPMTLMKSPDVKALAKKYSVTPGQIMLSYLNSYGMVSVAGTSKIKRIAQNIQLIKLSKKEIQSLKGLNTYDNKFEETYPH